MSKKLGLLLILMAAFVWISTAYAQTGVVMGTVVDDEGNPIDSAYVTLTSDGCGGGGCQGPDYATYTAEDGTYSFDEVDVDTYLAKARKVDYGMAYEEIEVIEGETLVVDFVLEGCTGGGGCIPDTLVVVEVEGWAILDSVYLNAYYLDEDGDGEPEYRLQFGPPWYEPGSGAERPEEGDFITVIGGLVDWVSPEMIIVYEIDGLFWRDPIYFGGGHGSGGHHGGGGHHGEMVRVQSCHPNPFNPETTLTFDLQQAGQVRLAVYNLQGQMVTELVNDHRDAGLHSVTWNASNLSSGIYLFRLDAGNTTHISKVVFTK